MTSTVKQTLGFEAEVKQLLHLVVHSLYSNKEVFLRELISNASDALEKLRFEALSDSDLYENDSELRIEISFDKDLRTVTLRDNGIGMTREEVAHNIGTIARSGTREFFAQLSGDAAKDSQLIGQFGVGFYSAFIVADRVTLTTRKAGTTAAHGVRWESEGAGEYTLETVERTTRGTEIVLQLKADEDEFLDGWRLRSIVRKFSDHVAFPIRMLKEHYGEEDETPPLEWETVNSASALWMKSREDITDEQYNEFYKHVSHDFGEPLARLHSRVEGSNEYTLLLYVPAHAPFDLWEQHPGHGVKLYVKRVFIMDDAEKTMPRYLRYIRGVIDSDSLPLNVSREILQENKQLERIRAGAVKKVLGLLEDLAKNATDKYTTFWHEFGVAFKEGIIEDTKNRDQIAGLLRITTTHSEGETQDQSLADYVSRMREGQDKIYYLTAESYVAAKHSPLLEVFRKKNLEVVLLTDRIDEWVVSHLSEFQGKSLVSIGKGDLDLEQFASAEEKQHEEAQKADFEATLDQLKQALGDKIKDARLSHRLIDSAACLVADTYDMSLTMERILKAAGQKIGSSKPILEINPDHLLINRLRNTDGESFTELATLLYEQSVLSGGGQLDDPAAFVQRMNRLLVG